MEWREREKGDGFARRSCRGDCKRDRRGGRKSLISTSTFNRAVGASIIGVALVGAHDYQLATGTGMSGSVSSMFPAAGRAAVGRFAVTAQKRPRPRINRTIKRRFFISFLFNLAPLPPYPTRSLVSSVRLPFRNWPRVSAATNPPPIKPTRWLTILCTVSIRKHRLSWQQERALRVRFSTVARSHFRRTVIRGGLHPFDRFSFRSYLLFRFFSSQYMYSSRRMV